MLDKKRLTLNILFQNGRQEMFLYFVLDFSFGIQIIVQKATNLGRLKKRS